MLWAYYFMGQEFVSAVSIILQRVNYVVVSFGDVTPSSGFEFPGGGCSGTGTMARCNSFLLDHAPTWFKTLHDAGIAIAISFGGAGAHLSGRQLSCSRDARRLC